MKLLITILFVFLLNVSAQSQTETVVAYDNVEDYNWEGFWLLGFDAGYFTNAFISSDASAALIGWGSGNSGIEDDIYYLPNVTGLDPSKEHVFRFRLGSYRFTGGSTAGVDSPDFVEVYLSVDGEISYSQEMRIRGFGNAYWDYNTNAIASKIADGNLTTFQPSAGGNRTNTGDGYSVIELYIPMGVTQVAIDIYARVNASGEEWWMDNFELISLDLTPLPVELISFTGENIYKENYIYWITASEINCSHYEVSRSIDGKEWEVFRFISGMGTTNEKTEYEVVDRDFINTVNYYRLTQVDFDGKSETFQPISIDNTDDLKVVKRINALGQEVDENATGLVIEIYNNNTINKKIRL